MSSHRHNMTVRVVPLRSAEAGDTRVAGTASERVALVAVLSAAMWAQTQQPLPTYTRTTMPIRVVKRQTVTE
jgi:hypothetical protein